MKDRKFTLEIRSDEKFIKSAKTDSGGKMVSGNHEYYRIQASNQVRDLVLSSFSGIPVVCDVYAKFFHRVVFLYPIVLLSNHVYFGINSLINYSTGRLKLSQFPPGGNDGLDGKHPKKYQQRSVLRANAGSKKECHV